MPFNFISKSSLKSFKDKYWVSKTHVIKTFINLVQVYDQKIASNCQTFFISIHIILHDTRALETPLPSLLRFITKHRKRIGVCINKHSTLLLKLRLSCKPLYITRPLFKRAFLRKQTRAKETFPNEFFFLNLRNSNWTLGGQCYVNSIDHYSRCNPPIVKNKNTGDPTCPSHPSLGGCVCDFSSVVLDYGYALL